jgi:hypothetical protein
MMRGENNYIRNTKKRRSLDQYCSAGFQPGENNTEEMGTVGTAHII